MDKKIKKIIIVYSSVIITLPILINFLIIYINCFPSAGDNESMFQAFTGYFGGAIGGLATLIAIYFTFINRREEHKPIIYFNNTVTYLYQPIRGGDLCFSKKYCCTDEDVESIKSSLSFELSNVGIYPALEVKLTIINLKDFLNNIKLLKISDDDVKKHYLKAFSTKDVEYLKQSLLKQGENTMVETTHWFDSFLSRLLLCYKINAENKKNENNNLFIKGRFKFWDIKVEYKDIDNERYEDYFTLFIRLDSLEEFKKFRIWKTIIEIDKKS